MSSGGSGSDGVGMCGMNLTPHFGVGMLIELMRNALTFSFRFRFDGNSSFQNFPFRPPLVGCGVQSFSIWVDVPGSVSLVS